MKIFIISTWPYHDNCTIGGAYSSEQLARKAMDDFPAHPSGWGFSRIVEVTLDAPALLDENVIETGDSD